MTEFEKTLLKVQEVVADVTGNDLDDVSAYTHLVDELGLTEIDLARLIVELNTSLGIRLKPKQIADEVETVYDLSLIVHDELNLG